MSLQTVKKLGYHALIKKSQIKITAYEGISLLVVGQCEMVCKCNGIVSKVMFQIIDLSNAEPVLEKNESEKFK